MTTQNTNPVWYKLLNPCFFVTVSVMKSNLFSCMFHWNSSYWIFLIYLWYEKIKLSSIQIVKASTLKIFYVKRIFKNFKVLAFALYFLGKLKNFFKVLAFPSYILKKELKDFTFWKNFNNLYFLLFHLILWKKWFKNLFIWKNYQF